MRRHTYFFVNLRQNIESHSSSGTAFSEMVGEKSEWCVTPDSFEWVSFTFSVDSLLHYLQEQLDALGYTAKLHRAILKARDVLEKHTVIDKKRKREIASINAGKRSRGSGQVDAPHSKRRGRSRLA